MKEPKGGISNIIGSGTTINGELKVEGNIRMDGTLEGNITVSDTLIVGKAGNIKGEIHAKDTLVGGKMEGNLIVNGRAEFQAGSRLKGDIKCKQLVIEEGVVFDGSCAMEKELKSKPGFSFNQQIKAPVEKPSASS